MVRVGAVTDAGEADLEADGTARFFFPMAVDSKLGCFSMSRTGTSCGRQRRGRSAAARQQGWGRGTWTSGGRQGRPASGGQRAVGTAGGRQGQGRGRRRAASPHSSAIDW